MRAVLALALKDLRLLARDPLDLFFTFAFPLFIAIFFGSIFGGGGQQSGMDIAVVDEDRTPASAAFVARLEKAPEFTVVRSVDDAGTPRPITSQEAQDRVRRGKLVASVVLPPGFGSSAENIFQGQPILIRGAVDPSRRAESGMLQGILTKYAFQTMTDMFADPARMRAMARSNIQALENAPGMDPAMRSALLSFLPSVDRFFQDAPQGKPGESSGGLAGFEPVRIELDEVKARSAGPAITNSYALTFPQAIVWGVLGCVTSFGISLTTERTAGTLVRLMLSPIARWQILAGKALACFLTTIAVATALLALGYLIFKVVPVSLPMLALALLSIAVGFVGVMMLVASIGRSAGGSAGLGRAVLLVLALIGGGSIPLFFMPPWMKTVSGISPFKWAIEALDGAIWRGFSPAEMALPCAVLLGIGVVGFALGARLFEWGARA